MEVNLRKNENSQNSGYGKYYLEVARKPTLSLKGFAQHMVDHGSIYSRDVIEGVLKKITQCLPELIAQGISVQLEPLDKAVMTEYRDSGKFDITPQGWGADYMDASNMLSIWITDHSINQGKYSDTKFDELYAALPLENCGYTAEEAKTASPRDMDRYSSPEEQQTWGVVGIELSPL